MGGGGSTRKVRPIDKRFENIKKYKGHFPYENFVFEGGGAKGHAYVGALQVFEECGILPHIKRVAGTSIGSVVATLIAIGCSPDDIAEIQINLKRKLFLDGCCGACCLLPNLITYYGWHPGQKVMNYFSKIFKKRCGDSNVTFKQVYQRFGRELCIVVLNVNKMDVEYCHVKTTPDMPIKAALRMAVGIPFVNQVFAFNPRTNKDLYVDAGFLCNYPVHCFDGWYLSLKEEDSFMNKFLSVDTVEELYAKRNHFAKYNEKTLGFIVYEQDENEMFRTELDKRNPRPEFPDTKLSRKNYKKIQEYEAARNHHENLIRAAEILLKALKESGRNEYVSRDQINTILSEGNKDVVRAFRHAFGEGMTPETIFRTLDKDKSGSIKLDEIVTYLESQGLDLQYEYIGVHRRDIVNVRDYAFRLINTVLTGTKWMYTKERDIERSVGINVYYCENMADLEPGDIKFLVTQGRKATLAFLEEKAGITGPSQFAGQNNLYPAIDF